MKTYLWDVNVYRQADEGQLPMEFLMSGQVEAPDKQKAAITMFKKVRELWGKDIEVDMVVTKREVD
ncbi:MAG: hypothetical protein E7201_01975 [Selenomonas ruminantium]|uniref:Uncharacterized protein n=1 Tax=Selenomonas ruminantium TaxID=971 RepID=A0A927WP67_SELRU|nr:hypothetical protein [Selenomonas ruminantium]